MFALGFFIGSFAYSIFLLGLFKLLYPSVVWITTILFIASIFFYFRKHTRAFYKEKKINKKINIFLLCLFFLIIAQIIVNFIGVLGPELGFDALWYHLTIPKLYLINHSVLYIPGGLLLYSAMPKLLEMIFVGGLSFGSEVFPKVIHFSFGILILISLYKISRKFLSKRLSLLAVVVFYSNLVVDWESISSYIDLGRTFFEVISFWSLLEWIDKKEKRLLIYSAIFIGLAITTKLLALGSFIIDTSIIYFVLGGKIESRVKQLFLYSLVAFSIPLPWLIFSYINTGNPVYPFFTKAYPVNLHLYLINPFNLIIYLWNLLLFSPDPINPFYLIMFPLFFIYFKNWSNKIKIILFYVMGGFFFWYVTPNTGGGRFIIPYLPLLSLLSVFCMSSIKNKFLKQFVIAVAIIISLSSIGYRAIANARFIPYIFGRETKTHFLSKHLNFSYGDFIDSDGYFKSHIKTNDTVLLYGFHNLFYLDFPFIESSWVKKGDKFNYVATQNSNLPDRFKSLKTIYNNPLTHVKLYSTGGNQWVY